MTDALQRDEQNEQTHRSRLAIAWLTLWRQLAEDWAVFRRNRMAMLGLGLLAVFALMALSHPILLSTVWPRGIYGAQTGYDLTMQPWPAPPRWPDHLLGVDALGRDTFSRLLAATQPSFTVAFSAALMTALVSTIFASLAAYHRGPLDAVVSNVSDALLLLPVTILMVIVGSQFYDEIGSLEFGLLYGVLAGASSATIVMRAHALTLMNRSFIEAARVSGAGAAHIILRHLVPHMLPLVAVHMMIAVVGAVVAEGFIAWLGFRTDLRVNWGTMIYDAIKWTEYRAGVAWPAIIAPTMALSLFAASFYFVARGLRDVSDPSTRS
jgi:peptide/nickel transport system permease protein